MSDKKFNLSTNNLVSCILYAVVGILLIALRSGSLGILFTVIGVLFIAMGVYDLIRHNWTIGAVETAVGIVILVCGWTIAEWVLLIFGILLIIKGALEIAYKCKNGINAMLSPIATIVIGILLVVSKFAVIDIMCIVAGVIFLINAILILFNQKLV